ncbi:fatty-acyl-CoA synthase [Sphaerisporangium melleum]|uniref:Fatty-acyl-CoA synthase n=1 Tax=Sphaerisporangium melleum TaxID=321316 RepID=A0A917R9E4_9ACTN|nr:long-chain fatty acid--CoA ligase [Sphaerisporangium melleum]GGK95956.1 fatty-acyl-CoA synthase [Sphaerisporangium melleum]GII70658.1 fatty-acyl-CoA synthase [Sphaerisporangium melleum]
MHNAGLGCWPARRAQMSPHRTAFVFAGRSVGYAEVHERTTMLASRLAADAGVTAGDRVAYLGPNHVAFAETMFATHVLGGIFVPLNFRLTAPEIAYMLADSGATVLVYAPECAHVVAALRTMPAPPPPAPGPTGLPGLPDLRTVVALESPAAGEREYETWLAQGDPAPIDTPVSPDEVALILYTSGTTGRPKGATLTHANLVWNCLNMMVGVDVTSTEVTLISAPLFHVAALNQTLLPTFLKGGTSVIMPSWDVDLCYDLIGKHRVTWMFGVTAMFAAFARSPRWAHADLSSLRTLMSGGASIPVALIRAYQERGLVFCQGYGLTETAPGATFLEADESERKAGSAGVPVFFADVRVARADLTDTAVGEPGEVLVRGPNVTPGYWRNPKATADAFTQDGWFRTGDIGTLDDEGHLYIVDRVKDMYISGGENVYPAEVEAVLFEHPAVAEAAVVGVPDDRWGEVGRAFVIPRPGATVTPADLRDFLRSRLAKYKIPVYFDLVDTLPRTGSGKIRKPPLRTRPLP